MKKLSVRLGAPLLGSGALFFSLWLVGLGGGQSLGRIDWLLVESKPWIQMPALFPFGLSIADLSVDWRVTAGALAVVLVGYLGSVLESLGDYAATASVAGTRLTDQHIDRGIMAEGLGSISATALGGLPCTSYSQNIGIIATTGVASRRVVQCAGLILLAYGLCPKFGGLLVALPRSSLGGVLLVVCAMIVVSGVRLLSSVGSMAKEIPWLGLAVGLSLVVPRLSAPWVNGSSAAGILFGNGVVVAVAAAIGIQTARSLLGWSRSSRES